MGGPKFVEEGRLKEFHLHNVASFVGARNKVVRF